MKRMLLRVFVPIFLSVLFGFICGKMVYDIYFYDNSLTMEDKTIYLIQNGAYSSYDSMIENVSSYNYIYFNEDNLFKTVIGVTMNKDNIDKIKKIFDGEVLVNSYYINDTDILNEIGKLDDELKSYTEVEDIRRVVNDILRLYKNDDKVKLIKIS